jgi:hypothetical protein
MARRRRRKSRSYRRNPSLRSITGQLQSSAKVAAVGAVGAIGLDLAYGYTKGFLPDTLTGNKYGALAIKAIGAVVVGMIGNQVMPGRGSQMATGAMTVIFHEAAKGLLTDNFPALAAPLNEYLDYSTASGPIVGTLNGLPDISSIGSSFETETLNEYLS